MTAPPPPELLDEVLAILVEGADALDVPIEAWTRYNGLPFDPNDPSGRLGEPTGTDGATPDPQTYRYVESLETPAVGDPDEAVRRYMQDRENAGWVCVGYAAHRAGPRRTITVSFAGPSGYRGELVATAHKLTLRAASPESADPAMLAPSVGDDDARAAHLGDPGSSEVSGDSPREGDESPTWRR